jgi:hypothetical protein
MKLRKAAFPMKRIFCAFFILMFGAHAESPIQFCDLLRNPSRYNGQRVRVRVTHRYVFEVSELFCLECSDKGRVWLDTTNIDDEASERAFRKMPAAGIVNLTIEGVFMAEGHFGHTGWPYQLKAEKIEGVKVLLNGRKPPEAEREIEKKWACGGAHPK